MILWFTIVQIVVAVAAGVFCLVAGLIGRRPSDLASVLWPSSRRCSSFR